VPYLIRPFRNTDTPHLARIWNLHHEAMNWPHRVRAVHFESCVLAKPFFVPGDLLIIEDDEQPFGFVHVAYGANAACDAPDPHAGILAALYIAPNANEELAADLLLTEAMKRFDAVGCPSVISVGAEWRNAFYIGIAPGDALMGVPARDSRLKHWLVAGGFQPIRPTEVWELPLDTFRAPMDRGQIAVKRTASVGKVLDDADPNWWHAVTMGHTEQISFQLFSRMQSNFIEEASLWYTDPAISGLRSHIARLWLMPIAAGIQQQENATASMVTFVSQAPQIPKQQIPREQKPREQMTREHQSRERTEANDRRVYLLSEAMRQLHLERFTTVRTVASADQQQSISILQRLGFQSVEPGMIFERTR